MSGTQRWMPDTCGCVLRYSWRVAMDGDYLVTSNYVSEKKCDQHRDAPNGAAHYEVVVAHNKAINEARAAAASVPLGMEPSPCGGPTILPG